MERSLLPPTLVKIYDAVRATGLPNAMAARRPLSTNLNLDNWGRCLGEIGGRPQLLDFLRFGFPLGYVGPVSDTTGITNHTSATDYPAQIDAFIVKERSRGGLLGPFHSPPFRQWAHISPLMSRPKSDPNTRRVITDMTFPHEDTVNSYIVKNGVYGIERDHSLPTVDDLVCEINKVGHTGVYLATLDIERAYKNFNSDPLDWPLLCFEWNEEYFCDLFSVPFGARVSSYHMQSVANAIVDILAHRGVKAFMYLDDMILLSSDRDKAMKDFAMARQLLKDLGLPEAVEKAKSPDTSVKWLGIDIDTANMTLSIPHQKLSEILEQVSKFVKARSMTKKQLQSIVGQLLHIAKCVPPARIFVARLLEALRATKGRFLNVNADMRADFRWFLEFGENWNGRSYIPDIEPSRDIYVDACLSGIGASDGKSAYAKQVANIEDGANNITELEAINVVVALHTMLSEQDRATHVRIHCDNLAVVQVLQSGKAVNALLLDCARVA